jgi:hypothetical protein
MTDDLTGSVVKKKQTNKNGGSNKGVAIYLML